MKTKYLLILITLVFSSCATLLNRDYVTIEMHTPEWTEVVISEDTFYTEDNFLSLDLDRQKAPHFLTVECDSSIKQIQLRSRLSPAFYGSILGFMVGAPLVEPHTPRMYTFPKSIYVDAKDTTINYQWYHLPRKGEWYLYTGLPVISHNLHYDDRTDEYLHRAGHFGFSLGLEYYYQKDRYFSFSVARSNAYQNFGDPEDLEYGTFSLRIKQISVAHHHRRNRFSFGYGFMYQNRKSFRRSIPEVFFFDDLPNGNQERTHNVVGLNFPVHIQLNQQLYIGFSYMPSLYLSPTHPKVKYQHLFIAEIAWKPRLIRGPW